MVILYDFMCYEVWIPVIQNNFFESHRQKAAVHRLLSSFVSATAIHLLV